MSRGSSQDRYNLSASTTENALNNGTSSRVLVRLQIGHISEKLPYPTKNNHTHKWTVYVRSISKELTDRSFIKTVIFQLHDSFENPRRIIKEPPFQVSETGYGGFTMPITIHFNGYPKAFTINYELSLSLDKSGQSNTEQRLELKNPSKELALLVQKYCQKEKREITDSTLMPSHSHSDRHHSKSKTSDKNKSFDKLKSSDKERKHKSHSTSKNASSKEEPTSSEQRIELKNPFKREPTDSTSKREPTDSISKREPTDSTSKREPTDSTFKRELIDSTSKREPTDSTFKESALLVKKEKREISESTSMSSHSHSERHHSKSKSSDITKSADLTKSSDKERKHKSHTTSKNKSSKEEPTSSEQRIELKNPFKREPTDSTSKESALLVKKEKREITQSTSMSSHSHSERHTSKTKSSDKERKHKSQHNTPKISTPKNASLEPSTNDEVNSVTSIEKSVIAPEDQDDDASTIIEEEDKETILNNNHAKLNGSIPNGINCNAETPISHDQRLQILVDQIHAIDDPDLIYQIADSLIETDSAVLKYDDDGHIDFDMYKIKFDSVLRLESIISNHHNQSYSC